jgi:hypothetical protein
MFKHFFKIFEVKKSLKLLKIDFSMGRIGRLCNYKMQISKFNHGLRHNHLEGKQAMFAPKKKYWCVTCET